MNDEQIANLSQEERNDFHRTRKGHLHSLKVLTDKATYTEAELEEWLDNSPEMATLWAQWEELKFHHIFRPVVVPINDNAPLSLNNIEVVIACDERAQIALNQRRK